MTQEEKQMTNQELDIPEFLKGFPIALITAGLMSIAFLGFQGLSF